jgi:hypothetical protein
METVMSAIAFNTAPFDLTSGLSRLLGLLALDKRLPDTASSNLKDLPDHILLDIGVDPRAVPTLLSEELARPDVFYQSLTAAVARNTAKS